MESDRRDTAMREAIARGGTCDICGSTGPLHMHEIIERSKTVGIKSLRWLSYKPEVCLFICPDCHAKAGEMTAEALSICVRRHGRKAVGDILVNMFKLRPSLRYEIELPKELEEYVTARGY